MLSVVRSYLRNEHLEGKIWLYYPFCCCPPYRHNRRHQDTDMALLRLLLPVSSILIFLSLRLVKFPHRYLCIWNHIYIFYLIMITFQRSQQPKPFGVPDLFFQPLDNSNWTMLDLRWGSLIFQGHVFFCTDARIVCSERQNSQIKENWPGLGVL